MTYIGASVGLMLGQVRVALLVYALGPAPGIATSLAVSTLGTLVGTWRHTVDGRVALKLLITIGVPSAVAAYITTAWAHWVDPVIMKRIIAGVVLLAGIQMLRAKSGQNRANASSQKTPLESDKPHKSPDPGKVDGPDAAVPKPGLGSATAAVSSDPAPARASVWRGRTLAIEVVLGTVLGALSGFVGLLLGSLRLPAMIRHAGVPVTTAIGTNLAIGTLTGVSAAVAGLRGGSVDLYVVAVLAIPTTLAAHYGARRTGRTDPATLTTTIAVILVVSGALMLTETLLTG